MSRKNNRLIAIAFFISGFAALIYQVVWQRALFATFGINIETVTVVVTAFLGGLGIGSFVGGILSERSQHRLELFALAELAVGAYGFGSLRLFHLLGTVGLGLSHVANALITIVALLPPTLLMGMTLPLLVAEGVQTSQSTGRTVGSLYFANTIGSGVAALAAVTVIMPLLGERGSVRVAGSLNIIVAVGVFALLRRKRIP